MQNITLLKKRHIIACLLVLLMADRVHAQVIIGAPNLGFSQACASGSFNMYNATFVFSPPSALASTNQFRIEMSDATGSFAAPVVVFTSTAGAITTSPATVTFSVPTNSSGEGYKIRIKSTAPVATSSNSITFAAYYKSQDTPFTINNLVSTGAFCTGGSYLLTIDNPGSGENDSPLIYPSLTFNWFRETSATTSVFVSSGNTLTVSQAGTFFARTNYGTCTSNSFSNRVTISEAVSGQATASIVSSLGNPFCPEEGMTTLNTIGGNSYQWFKDGNLIPEATGQMYQTDESGEYSVQVNLGSCEASGSIILESEGFTASLNIFEENELELGEMLDVIATTTAESPIFEWFLNESLIAGATENSYSATQYGDYKLIISQTAGCEVSKELTFTINEPVDPFPEVDNIPNLISPNGDGINDTWTIPTQYVSGTETEVTILSNRGEVVFQTSDYQNNWPENQLELTNVNFVFYYIIKTRNGDEKKGSITIVK